jgi:hypothetical protein
MISNPPMEGLPMREHPDSKEPQDPIFLLDVAGSLTLTLPPILIGHGVAASGSLATTVPLPALPPGIEAFTVYTQGAAVSPVGAAVLAAPSVMTIL